MLNMPPLVASLWIMVLMSHNFSAYFTLLRPISYQYYQYFWRLYTPCPRKKEANLIFDTTSPRVKIFFKIFEAPCSGLISAWYSLLHTHHRCEAFTWCDVTYDVSQAVAHLAHQLDLEARARASGSERETGRARASEIFPVSERQYIQASRSERNLRRHDFFVLYATNSKQKCIIISIHAFCNYHICRSRP